MNKIQDIQLIQRGTFKNNIGSVDITGFDSIINLDYMGKAEFEFGALPASLKRMVSAYRNTSTETSLFFNNKRFCILTTHHSSEEIELIKDFIMTFTGNNYSFQMIGYPCFNSFYVGKKITQLKKGCKKKTEVIDNKRYTDFWWDVVNDFMIYDESYYSYVRQAFDALIERNFDDRKLFYMDSMPFKNKIRAILCGKRIYYIPDFKKYVFASSKKQCEGKFFKHTCEKVSLLKSISLILK